MARILRDSRDHRRNGPLSSSVRGQGKRRRTRRVVRAHKDVPEDIGFDGRCGELQTGALMSF